jgi:hypothetical protein
MRAGDPDRDIGWIEIDMHPKEGFLVDYVARNIETDNELYAVGGGALRAFVPEMEPSEEFGGEIVQAQSSDICARWKQTGDAYPILCPFPVAYPGDITRFYGAANYVCPDAAFFQGAICYVPFSSTFTGFDTFTYVGVDEFGQRSAPASVTIEIFEV